MATRPTGWIMMALRIRKHELAYCGELHAGAQVEIEGEHILYRRDNTLDTTR